MKKILSLSLVAIFGIFFQGNTSSTTFPGPLIEKSKFLTYTWYYDADMMDPVGTESTTGVEIDRLRDLYPFNVFSSTFSIGLHAYEFGYYSPFITSTIYSNK